MIVSHISGLLFFAFMNICESEIVAANRGPENPEKGAPPAGVVRARLPAKPMNSVFEREPWGHAKQ